jgi:hypothetical protein
VAPAAEWLPGQMGLGMESPEWLVSFRVDKADLEFDGHPLKNIGVRYKGNGTYMQSQIDLKRSLKIDLNDHMKEKTGRYDQAQFAQLRD